MRNNDRTGFVVVHLSIARHALEQGELSVARGALRTLRTTDFFGGAAVAESHLGVIRDQRSTDDDIRDAVSALVRLRPIGIGSI